MDEHLAREVARGLRDGRPDAWRALYDAFAERVWCLVARLVGPSSADVADVVQETMLAAARSARTYDPACGPLWHWLCGIARLQVALHFRKLKRQDRFKSADGWLAPHRDRLARWLDGSEDPPPDLLETGETIALVRLVLAELPDEYGTLLTDKYLDGVAVEQLAARNQTTETAVRSKLARAREAFRTAFLRLSHSSTDAEPQCGGVP
ncbi:ECF RNA polymerase sigma-E factor [Gemmata obscuriglobus]|uniref:Sigma-70 family RNA polymerase sigma factor n=1 Tax=Gemmata obscuriglobus TaxID=114 RepID=A0A2Z3H8Z0_9BACT|nr:sigma-70 family RNA polymerase sigma factor [Gemmata obscuriglobus]AWM39465.1 sigma-70 family RNA polymerase sigma factor [Gemmata obscuriglobus]QEG27449.1 ECF RNA polymerase sigma-E factor [Gemmata obscuriglobus]VTS04417.1 rna polymerase sigma factor : RNA polymerase, sigma-24 subunit, ECF subfamily OS=Pirellula staleyi (strain ATCC 27377 / DSM 6068 / ICPB 4128) GN=Psta_1896 PE=4 SV=1: Sigma70_r2: Sigma70_r4_2 [Gemmata obscuriglobus UQM 2246]